MRIITNSKYNAHTEPIMKALGILKLEDLFKFNMLKWYYRFKNKELPAYFLNYEIRRQSDVHNYNTRNNRRIASHITRTKSAQNCLRHKILSVINETSLSIIEKIETHSYKGFAKYAKNQIITEYKNDCEIENCYICNS